MITGNVERIAQRENNFSFLVNGIWYSDFGKCPYKEKESVSFDATKNGEYWNITKKKPEISTTKISGKSVLNTLSEIKTADQIEDIDNLIGKEILIFEKIYEQLHTTKLF